MRMIPTQSRSLVFAAQSAALAGDEGFSSSRLLNLYAETAPDGARAPALIRHTAGLRPLADLGGPVRALLENRGVLYAVAGGGLFVINRDEPPRRIGDLIDAPETSMAAFGDQVAVVAGGFLYVLADHLQDLGPAAYLPFHFPASMASLDGIALYAEANSGRFWFSAPYGPDDVGGADFITAESSSDDLLRVLTTHQQIWLFGLRSIEIWYNSGGAPPFARASEATIERGCGAAGSVATMDHTPFWLGEDGIVYRAQGYQPVRISTHALERVLSDVDWAQIRALTYAEQGHAFYCLILPGRPAWCFDAATGLWHERGAEDGWAVSCSAVAPWGERLLGGDDGRLFVLDRDHHLDGTALVRREAISAPFHDGDRLMACSRLHADLRTGAPADAALSWSDDGGATWRAPSLRRAEGRRRVQWHALGSFRERAFRLAVTADCALSLYSAHIELEARTR